MQDTITQQQATTTKQTAKADGTFVRWSAIAIGSAYTLFVVGAFVAIPELRTFKPMWFSWALVTTFATATHFIGAELRRRSGVQSKRTRNWIDAHRYS